VIAVVDYGGGNVASAIKALQSLGAECVLASDPRTLASAERVVLPGVGAFGDVMAGLLARGLVEPLVSFLRSGHPFLGICVGLQVLFESSEESPGVSGLGLLKGSVVRFRQGKVPQIGWNDVEVRSSRWLLPGHYYFVNSYYPVPADPGAVSATSDHHGAFCCAVEAGPVCAVQFHPEKSGRLGLESLGRWLKCW
jgi:imidazole glycerol phosphate synthase glutamine amidotransferase subunit